MKPYVMQAALFALGAGFGISAHAASSEADFAVIKQVLQHPRCQNCHIPGDQPLQYDEGRAHAQFVQRGVDGKGAPGMTCSTCHGSANLPASYGGHVPPGAPNWHLPPADKKMVFIGLDAHDLCVRLKDTRGNNGKDLPALLEHVDHDPLVLWGWNPGQQRAPVAIPHADFVAAFRRWVDAGGLCPG
jgi:hypothetical protein